MLINTIKLINFRNHKNKEINFKTGLNIILGNNGVGKTNILEAVYFSCIFKSLRNNNSFDLIKFNEDYAYVEIDFIKKENKINLIYVLKNSEKKIILNKKNINKIKDVFAITHITYFSPEEIKIVKESPSFRRRFMDIAISQNDIEYFDSLYRFNKILKNRNAFLKTQNQDLKLLDILDKEFAKISIQIYKKRHKFINDINIFINDIHNFLTSNKESIILKYKNDLMNFLEYNEEDFYKILIKNRERDIKTKQTNIGPHKDDFLILINNLDARQFASQGQQRTATLTLKLSEAKYLEKKTEIKPIILLDDVLSELDKQRSFRLLQFLKNYQTIITGTDLDIEIKANIIKL